jgi:alkylation response protein AidB-like acyl-CoA dehydrogenase
MALIIAVSRLPGEVADLLAEAGLFRMWVPKLLGGNRSTSSRVRARELELLGAYFDVATGRLSTCDRDGTFIPVVQ